MGNLFVKTVAWDFGIQWVGWILAATLKTEKFYDLTGSLTHILLILLSLQGRKNHVLRQFVNSGMVLTWAARLGFFLFTRVLKDGGDKRFDVVKHKPGVFWIYWTVQGVWILSTLLPTLIVNSKKQDEKINYFDYTGWIMWVIGFALEIIADWQKTQFKNIPQNHGKFITSGLWSICRHPNYFGEILMWTGLYLSALPNLKGWEHISVISPVFLTYLLTRVSGIPLLEKQGMKRWGGDPAFQAYIKNTATLIPFVW